MSAKGMPSDRAAARTEAKLPAMQLKLLAAARDQILAGVTDPNSVFKSLWKIWDKDEDLVGWKQAGAINVYEAYNTALAHLRSEGLIESIEKAEGQHASD